MTRLSRFAGVITLSLCAAGFLAVSPSLRATPAPLQMNGGQGSGFLGAWCAQGDPSKHASISGNGVFLTLTNENGDTSPGNLQGSNRIQAPGWQFVTGTLNGDGSQINWSNGTYWARCDNGGGGGRRRPILPAPGMPMETAHAPVPSASDTAISLCKTNWGRARPATSTAVRSRRTGPAPP